MPNSYMINQYQAVNNRLLLKCMPISKFYLLHCRCHIYSVWFSSAIRVMWVRFINKHTNFIVACSTLTTILISKEPNLISFRLSTFYSHHIDIFFTCIPKVYVFILHSIFKMIPSQAFSIKFSKVKILSFLSLCEHITACFMFL